MTINPKAQRNTCAFCSHPYKQGVRVCPRCGHPANVLPKPVSKVTQLLSEADDVPLERIPTGPWDACFGPDNGRDPNGIVKTSVALIGGKNGGGKSTLSLMLSDIIAGMTKREVLYVCSEEDIPQVKDRAKRILVKNRNLIRGLSTLQNADALMRLDSIIVQHQPCALILDSLTGLMGKDLAGQIELCKILKGYSSKLQFPAIVIDHVTKSEDFAGLEELQHTVDTTISLFPSDFDINIRILETQKNRFGRAGATCFLEMTERGLVKVEEGEISHDD